MTLVDTACKLEEPTFDFGVAHRVGQVIVVLGATRDGRSKSLGAIGLLDFPRASVTLPVEAEAHRVESAFCDRDGVGLYGGV